MNYRSMPRTNYFTYIMVLNTIVTVFNAIGLMGILDKDPFLVIVGGVGILVFFASLYVVFRTVIHLEKSRDEIVVENIKRKYVFSTVELAETEIEDRIKYGAKVIVSAGNVPEELFLTTNASTSEPYLYRVVNGGKTLVDEEYARQNQMNS